MSTSSLHRSRTDRVWKGVCAGLAHQLNLDPIVVRMVVVALAWATNVWPVLIAYVVAAKVIPTVSADEEAAEWDRSDTDSAAPALVVGWGAIILGGALLLHQVSAWIDGSLVLAVAAIAIGINLVLRGRDEDRQR